MRLKTFAAPTMSEAMALVRKHMGDDAIIVSTQRGDNGRGFRITAALDGPDPELEPPPGANGRDEEIDVADALTDLFDRHGVPGQLAERLVGVAQTLATSDPVMALAGALD